jgi:hypothetical protein
MIQVRISKMKLFEYTGEGYNQYITNCLKSAGIPFDRYGKIESGTLEWMGSAIDQECELWCWWEDDEQVAVQ